MEQDRLSSNRELNYPSRRIRIIFVLHRPSSEGNRVPPNFQNYRRLCLGHRFPKTPLDTLTLTLTLSFSKILLDFQVFFFIFVKFS